LKIKLNFLLSAGFVAILLLLNSCVSLTGFTGPNKLYLEARQLVKEGRPDFAFLTLNELLRTYPDYVFAAEARFAIAEYYFLNRDYTRATGELVTLLTQYPDHKVSIFAKAFLYKMVTDPVWIENQTAAEVAKQIKEQFFANPAFFVFSEFKEKKLASLLGNHYLLKEYVDKIDIFANGKLLLSVSP
jgi:outer membrane protein assembly factor BamD (BamD/ComL family)